MSKRGQAAQPAAYYGVRKYRLTLVFLAVSALTIGLAAASISLFAARTAESNMTSLARSQAARDTKLIAELVSTFVEQSPSNGAASSESFAAPGEAAAAVQVTLAYPELLTALNVVEVQLFDLEGEAVWVSHADANGHVPEAGLFAPAAAGAVTSELMRGAAVIGPSGDVIEADVVRTYIPVISSSTGEPAAVMAVTRDVTSDLASQTGELQESLTKTTLLTLGGVFLALLGVVMTADRKIWTANNLALEGERGRAAQLGREKDDIARQNASINTFVSVFSHESMTPVTSTLAFVELVLRNKDANLTPSQVKQLEVARRNSQRLVRMVGDLLALSRQEKGTNTLERSLFDVRACMEFATQEMMPALQAKSQTLSLAPPPDGELVFADRDRVTQVLVNLISNASKYSMAGTEIMVNGAVDGDDLTVSVTDHGIGMSAEDQKDLFKMFYRADNQATRSIAGTGIGLAVAKEIVRLHGGEISVDSSPGVGTKVTFHIPRGVNSSSTEVRPDGLAAQAA